VSTTSASSDEAILGKAYDARLMGRLWRFVGPHKRLLLLALVMMPVAVGFELAQPYLLKVAIDDHIAVGKAAGLGLIAAAYLALVILQSLANFAQLYALQLLGQRAMHDLRVSTYQHVLKQRAAFFDRVPVGRLLTRMTNDVDSINEMFASGVVTLVADAIKLASIIVMMFVLDVRLTLITFLTLPLLTVLVAYGRKLMRRSFRRIRVKLAAMNAFVAEHLSGIKVVQLFAREKQATRAYNEINADYRDSYLGAIRADASMYAGVEAIAVISAACIAWYASGKVGTGIVTVGLVVAFIEYVNKFFVPVKDFSAKYTVMQSAMAAAERIMDLLDTDEPDAPTKAGEATKEVPRKQDALAIEMADVRFSYRPGEEILRGMNLEVERGQTVAIVGATGSGKSTLIKLLTRLYDIEHGTIRVDGVDIRDQDVVALRRRITVISQDVFLFTGTVEENIVLERDDLDRDAVDAALERVGAAQMLRRRDADASAAVEERGGNFSAGERQLIAFARALVRDPDILVLDEATAHVDPEAEAWIERGLAELMQNRTTLIIAHRLSTVRNADRIVVVSRGRIVEQGSRDELIAADGIYAKLERTFSHSM
jgi:ATP-binding cassette subfamily B protein